MKEKIKKIFRDRGVTLCGFAAADSFNEAPRGFHPRDIFKECKSVIAYALPLSRGLVHVSPRIAYTQANNTLKNELDRIAAEVSPAIEALGCRVVPVPCDDPYEYWDEEKREGKGILSMKHAALLAGIGSMGKNTLIMNRQHGSFINLGALLTDLSLESDPPAENLCIDNCRRCLDACPQKALDGVTVNQKLCRQYTYVTNARGFDVNNCNSCRVACPWTRGA